MLSSRKQFLRNQKAQKPGKYALEGISGMGQTKVDRFIQDYCGEHGIKLLVDPNLSKDDGLCYPPYKEIHMALKYSSAKVKLATFFHELGHLKNEGKKAKPYNIFECELLAWAEGMKIYKKLFGKSFSKTQSEYMLKCLKTYCRSQYEFQKMPAEPEED